MIPKPPFFATGHDIQAFFRASKQAVPVDALKTLRNQLSIRAGENAVPVQDARVLLAKEWLELSPGANEVFGLLENHPQPAVATVCLSILATLLTLTSQHLLYQSLGQPIAKTLLSSRWLRKMDSYLSGSHSELCLVALKLLNAVSKFAGGQEQKGLLESFRWDVKIFHKLLYMRRKEKNYDYDILSKPDIRTLCMQFILSFVTASSSYVKTSFLEQHRDIFLSVFKGLGGDPYPVIRYTLEILWTDLWQDQKVTRTLKIGLFGEKTIHHLLKLYERNSQEGSSPENIPADVVHHFLLAISTHRAVGICFIDNGWYPRRESEGDGSRRKEKIYNKILSNILKMLKVNEDARQQELALMMLRACPELAAEYLQSMVVTLEPRLSSKWLANMAFFGAIVSLPVPVDCFYLPNGTAGPSSASAHYAYQPVPPPLSTVIDNIIPGTVLKTHLSKALQSPHALVQHTAGLALAQCLRKCETVLSSFSAVETALEEDETEGQWAYRRNELEREMRKRIPEIGVIIAFANAQRVGPASSIRSAMLSELSQRLLWLYQRCVPSVTAEARYDPSKSLRSLLDAEAAGAQLPAGIEGLYRLHQLHILHILSESDQFDWQAKPAHSTLSNLHILLDPFFKTNHPSVRDALSALLSRALGGSLLFQHNPEELHVWLDALPTAVRPEGGETPDGAPLKDERECVKSFLEACIHRCAKTPHRYIEDLDAVVSSFGDGDHSLNVSPLLMAVLEQLDARMRNCSLEPSDALALTTFIRKVVVGLLGRQSEVGASSELAMRLRRAVTADGTFPELRVIAQALRKECDVLDACISWCLSLSEANSDLLETRPSGAILDFVTQVEKLENANANSAALQAYGLVDWIRLVDQPLSQPIVERIIRVIKRLHAPALASFCLHLPPGSGLLWSLSDDDLSSWVPMNWILLHVNWKEPTNARCASILGTTLQKGQTTLYDYTNLAGLLLHRLQDKDHSLDVNTTLELLALLVKHAKDTLSSEVFSSLQTFIVSDRQQLRTLSCVDSLSESLILGIGRLFDLMLDATSASDQELVSPIWKYWVTAVSEVLGRHSLHQLQHLSGSVYWLKFMSIDGLRLLTDQLIWSVKSCNVIDNNKVDGMLGRFVDALLSSLMYHEGSVFTGWLNQHLGAFLALRKRLVSCDVLDNVISRSVSSGIPFGCDGFRTITEGISLCSVVATADTRWTCRLMPLPDDASLDALIDEDDWNMYTPLSVASFIYRSPVARRRFLSWLTMSDLSKRLSPRHLLLPIHAFFDTNFDGELLDMRNNPVLNMLFISLTEELFSGALKENDGHLYAMCLLKMLRGCPLQMSDCMEVLSKEASALSSNTLHVDSLCMVHPLVEICAEGADAFVETVVNHALQWAVRHLSENVDSSDVAISPLAVITDVVRLGKGISLHYAEPVIAAGIRKHLCHSQVAHLVEALFSSITLKPVSVNRHLQSILQHAKFGKILACNPAGEEREAITKLLCTIFLTHPANTCQLSHVEPLLRLYSGSLSIADRRILSIFRVFEEQRKCSIASILVQWPQSSLSHHQTGLEAISSLDATRVFRTCLSFPDRRSMAMHGELDITSRADDALIYDPVFLLLLFAQALAERPPQSALSWVSLYRSNVVCLVIRCLSSADRDIRKIARLQLGCLYKQMKAADMQERDHVAHLLDITRDSLRSPPEQAGDDIPRLPSYTTLFLSHALRGIFYPASFIYPLTARFLLQRPEIDVHDVPMLYEMLYNSGDNWKKSRIWLIRFLADGMLSSADWRLMKRRHIWDLLASLFQGSFEDRTLRHLILEVLANLTCQAQATVSLILKSSLVEWLEVQLREIKSDERVAWVKIIENILVTAQYAQIDQSTEEEWQAVLLRCLICLMNNADVSLLCLISRAMSRLTSETLRHSQSISHALESALERLEAFEGENVVTLPTITKQATSIVQDILPPHRSFGLHQRIPVNSFESWGRAIECLWSLSLTHGVHGPLWDRLSSRLLLWRAACDERVTPLGEWARRQCVQCLISSEAMPS